MSKNDEYIKVLKEKLTEYRFNHSVNVANSANELALIYGEDPEKAYTVGLIHDVCKDTPAGLQLSYILENKVPVTEQEIDNPKLYHSITGAEFCKNEFGISDINMLNAVRYHTTGRADMSLLEKIVFIADFISAERDYNGVEIMREKAMRSLDEAIVEGLSFTIKDLIDREMIIHPDTLGAYNDALNQLRQKED